MEVKFFVLYHKDCLLVKSLDIMPNKECFRNRISRTGIKDKSFPKAGTQSRNLISLECHNYFHFDE